MKTHEGSRECRRLIRKNRNLIKDLEANAKEGSFQTPDDVIKKIAVSNEKFIEDDNVPRNLVQEIKTKSGFVNINLEDLPIYDPDFNHSSPNSFYAAQLLSPPCFNPKVDYGITNPQVFLKSFASSMLPSQSFPKLTSPGPKEFLGGYADFTSFAQDISGVNGLLLEPGNTSPHFAESPYVNSCPQQNNKEANEDSKF